MSNLNNNTTQLEALLAKVNALPNAGSGGVDLPELSNAGTAADLMLNKELIDSEGNKVTGTFTLQEELTAQDDLISQISTLVATKANPQGGTDTNDATAIASDILSGKTAYVKGQKITGNIALKSIATYTPTTTNQIIGSGVYLAGDQTIAGDANLVAGNIKSGVSIFGVTGTYSGGSGSGNVEICSVTIMCAGMANFSYTTVDDAGQICSVYSTGIRLSTSVVCGTHVSVVGNTLNATTGTVSLTNAEVVCQKDYGAIFKITANVNEEASITIMGDMLT